MIGALVAGITGSGGASLSSYESIATVSGTGSSGTITFSSIPSTFKHLQIRAIGRDTTAATTRSIDVRVNSDTGSNYARHLLNGNGTAVSATGADTVSAMDFGLVTGASAAANTMGVLIVDVLDYASTSKYKTFRVFNGEDRNGAGNIYINSGLWMSTSAITSISFIVSTAWTTSTTFALYGIKEA